jgi:lauroyl/myristoyl acyltransferase
VIGRAVLQSLRAAERLAGPAGLRIAAWPPAFICALLDRDRIHAASLPGAVRFHLTRALCAIPDRLARAPWQGRCVIENAAALDQALANRRPVVLATVHFGGLLLLRYWLRARGYPVASLVAEVLADRVELKLHKDALSPFTEIPNVLSGQAPREAVRFLQGGGALMVMLDHQQGRQARIDVPEGRWVFSPTAFRLASLTDAVLLPVSIQETAPWRFVVRLGRPVPEASLKSPADYSRAARHVWGEFQPVFAAAPGDWTPELAESLRPSRPGTSNAEIPDASPCPKRA